MGFPSTGKEFVRLGDLTYLEVYDIPVGHIEVTQQEGYDEIWNLEVYKQYRGRSYGSQLIDHALSIAKQSVQKLHVKVDNLKALQMYQRRGFKIDLEKNQHFKKQYYLMSRTRD